MSTVSEKLPEPEELAMLRHRFGRTIEVWIAYSAFLRREILTGPNKFCVNDKIVEQTTHTLLIIFYSFIHSMFDKSGVDFTKISQGMLNDLTPAAKEARAIVVDVEKRIHPELEKIRNNIGFHQGNKRKKHLSGYGAYDAFHPWIPMLIMDGLRVFFREVDKRYAHKEEYGLEIDEKTTEEILEFCRKIKRDINADKVSDLATNLRELGQILAAEKRSE